MQLFENLCTIKQTYKFSKTSGTDIEVTFCSVLIFFTDNTLLLFYFHFKLNSMIFYYTRCLIAYSSVLQPGVLVTQAAFPQLPGGTWKDCGTAELN